MCGLTAKRFPKPGLVPGFVVCGILCVLAECMLAVASVAETK